MNDTELEDIFADLNETDAVNLGFESILKKEMSTTWERKREFNETVSPFLHDEDIFDILNFNNYQEDISTTYDNSQSPGLQFSFSEDSSSPEMLDWFDSCSTSNSQSHSRQSNNDHTPTPFMAMKQLPLTGFCAAGGTSALYPQTSFTPIILQPMMQHHNNFKSSTRSFVNSSFESCFNYSFLPNSSGLLKMPEDAIVYVPTPVRALQSGFFYGSGRDGASRQMSWWPQSGMAAGFVPVSPTHKRPSNRGSASNTNGSVDACTEDETSQMMQTEKMFSCSTCTVKFTRRDELRRHEKIHSGEKPLSCPYCDKCFIRSDHRKTHIRTHTGEKPYACDICCKRFARSDEKLRHTKTHFKERSKRRRRRTTTADSSRSIKTTNIELATEAVSQQQVMSAIPSVATVLDNTFDLSFFHQDIVPQQSLSTNNPPRSNDDTHHDPLDCLDDLSFFKDEPLDIKPEDPALFHDPFDEFLSLDCF